jgi:uncharacterized protein
MEDTMHHARLNTIALIIPALLLASIGVVRAQAILPTSESGVVQGLTVHGHGEIHAKPNIARATLTVVTSNHDQNQAVTDNSTATHTVIAALKGSMIADKDIQTDYYNVQPQYDYRTSPPVLVGYQVTDALRITVHDLPKLGIILDKATRAGATSIDNVAYDLSDNNRVVGEALVLAIANARSKADLMAGAAGVELVRIVSVSEGSTQSVQSARPVLAAAMAATSAAQQPTPMQPQDIDVEADATLVYSIQPHH